MQKITKALSHIKPTHYGYYHDIGLVLEKFTVKELFDYCIASFGENNLRSYLEEQIIQDEIIKSKNRKSFGGN